jgi:hypothetical protein
MNLDLYWQIGVMACLSGRQPKTSKQRKTYQLNPSHEKNTSRCPTLDEQRQHYGKICIRKG